MGQLGFAGEDKNLSTYFTIGGEKGIGRAAVDQNDRRLQPPDQFLQAALKRSEEHTSELQSHAY